MCKSFSGLYSRGQICRAIWDASLQFIWVTFLLKYTMQTGNAQIQMHSSLNFLRVPLQPAPSEEIQHFSTPQKPPCTPFRSYPPSQLTVLAQNTGPVLLASEPYVDGLLRFVLFWAWLLGPCYVWERVHVVACALWLVPSDRRVVVCSLNVTHFIYSSLDGLLRCVQLFSITDSAPLNISAASVGAHV